MSRKETNVVEENHTNLVVLTCSLDSIYLFQLLHAAIFAVLDKNVTFAALGKKAD